MNNNTPQQQQQQQPQQQQQQQKQQTQTNMQTGSGLTRYRSAPSSYFTALLNTPPGGDPDADGFGSDDFAQVFNLRASSPETQRIFSRFMNSSTTSTSPAEENKNSFPNTTSSSSLNQQQQQQTLPPPKNEPDHAPPPPLQRQRSNDYSSAAAAAMYQNSGEDNLQNKGWGNLGQIKMESAGGNSGLIRHSSSPAGLFANINIESGEFGGMRSSSGINRNYTGGNNAHTEASSLSRFNNSHLDFSSSSRIMDPISEIGGSKDENQNSNEDTYISDYINSWDDSALLSDNFLDDQGNEPRSNRPLSHHLSLPKSTSAELTMDKLMQDSVPCKIRAKRGCATHPRSIAERVRRTKISERIRKLQELVPNMEKQTSTSDMLDLAVDYIKDLQKQVKALSDNKDQCSCEAKHQ